VGREAEYPVVGPDGHAFDISLLWADLERGGARAAPLEMVRAPDGMITSLKGSRYTFASEVGLGTIEVITGPRHDLMQLKEDHEAAVERLLRACEAHGAVVLGLGTQPLTSPSAALMTPKPRYQMLLDRIGPDWLSFCVTASDQVHVDVAEPEVVAMTNLGNILAPVFIALCGNSPIVAGEDTGVCSWREAAMGAIEAAGGRHGMPHAPIASIHEHVERIVALEHLLHKEGDVPHPVSGRFSDFLQGIDCQSDAAFAAFLVQDHYVWHSARPRYRQGTVELRAPCQQPWAAHMSAAALGLGVIAGGAEIGRYIGDVLGNDAWQKMRAWHAEVIQHGLSAQPPVPGLVEGVLERAQAALRGRGRREEMLLEPLFRVVATGQNPAQRARSAFAEGGMAGLIQYSRLPASLR